MDGGNYSSQGFQEESNKKIWIFIGVFVVVLIIALFIFLFMKFSSNKISSEELSEGTYFNMKVDKQFEFEIDEEEHKLILDAFGEDYVDLTVQSKPIKFTLKIGESKKFDLDNDEIYDLRIKLVRIENNKPYIFIKEISETICVEDWDCGEWSDCISKKQNRTCEDLANCGKNEDKPEEEQSCEEDSGMNMSNILTCSEQNGKICNSTQICNGTIINSSNSGRCCDGDCVLATKEVIDCGSSILTEETIGNTPNFDCFIDASENCDFAKLSFTNSLDFGIFGLIATSTASMELRGIELNKCIYYQKTDSFSLKFNDELIQQMLENNITLEEINQAEQKANDDNQQLIGMGFICSFDIDDLNSVLKRWNNGTFSVGLQCEGMNCVATGDFENAECEQFVNHDENCHIMLGAHTPSLEKGSEGFVKVVGFTNANEVLWLSNDETIATVNPSTGSSTTITAVDVGNISITAVDTNVGYHCNASLFLEVHN